MKRIGKNGLIADLLNNQLETFQHNIDQDRIEQILRSGEKFTEKEALILWSSPSQRRKFLYIRKNLQREVNGKIAETNISRWHQPMAASSESDSIEMIVEGYKLNFYQEQNRWFIELMADISLSHYLLPTSEVIIEDSQGEVWLQGKLDSQRQLISIWPLEIVPSLALSREFKLSIR